MKLYFGGLESKNCIFYSLKKEHNTRLHTTGREEPPSDGLVLNF